ncbi:hypothetical protein [uncultured Thiothrix sp.]|uniref:copper amine oxidase n=1 Tax=uncultured Thiothrix sp. TaxID=223185 RepID=UPI00260E978F|nr:hypothetical protein [uncultured Thiothrix sp.]
MSLLNKKLLTALLMFCCSNHLYAAPNPVSACNGTSLEARFDSGVAWSMCVSLEQNAGLVIQQLKLTSLNFERRVLGQASLAQLETVFDDNKGSPSFAVTRDGLGADKLVTLTSNDCPNGKLYPDPTGRNVVCTRYQADELLYKYAYQAYRQTSYFEVFSISQGTSLQTYTQRWRFYENGVIEPALGFSGKLPRFANAELGFGRAVKDNNQWALGFSSYLGWRLDFDLGKDPNNDIVEEITSTASPSRRQKYLNTEVLQQETARNLNPELKTSWRIKDGDETNSDGRTISYEIFPSNYYQSVGNFRGRPWLSKDIYFTHYQTCEQYASDNKPTGACARNALQYTENKEIIEKSDLVVWYKQNYHYLPRSDDSDYMSTDWVSFQLVPRDWTATNPL